MSDILTKDELIELTGYLRPTQIDKWLMENGVPSLLSRNGWPKVHRQALAHRMGASTKKPKADEPNFDDWDE